MTENNPKAYGETEETLFDRISYHLKFNNETWDDVIMHTIHPDKLTELMDDICDPREFFIWTNKNVYYDCWGDDGFDIWFAPRFPPEQI